jgi:hypothetical protein
MANGMVQTAPMIAHRKELAGRQGTYLLDVADGVGPVTVTIRDADLTVEQGTTGTPDVTLHLTADQYVRLIVGRFGLDSEQGRRIQIDGDREKARGLNRVFAGVANE